MQEAVTDSREVAEHAAGSSVKAMAAVQIGPGTAASDPPCTWHESLLLPNASQPAVLPRSGAYIIILPHRIQWEVQALGISSLVARKRSSWPGVSASS